MTEQHIQQSGSQESAPTQIQPVLGKLRTITAEAFQEKLSAEVIDPKVGFAHVRLPEYGSVVAGDGQVYYFHVARIVPGGHVNPHVHYRGDEPYRIVTGEEGVMHIGTTDGKIVNWSPAIRVRRGGEIIVRVGEVHSFENTGSTPVDFTFACPASHLDDTQDRQMTTNFQNGFPQYQNP